MINQKGLCCLLTEAVQVATAALSCNNLHSPLLVSGIKKVWLSIPGTLVIFLVVFRRPLVLQMTACRRVSPSRSFEQLSLSSYDRKRYSSVTLELWLVVQSEIISLRSGSCVLFFFLWCRNHFRSWWIAKRGTFY